MAYHHQPALFERHNGIRSSAAISEQFADPLDCLTAHLLMECSEVLAGVKPANLVSLVNRTRPCGRNLQQLWQTHQRQLITRINPVEFLVLQSRERATLLLCFNREQLRLHLCHSGIAALLAKAGYAPGLDLDALLAGLARRFDSRHDFPHEIGLFIGYPAKDVAAFMGLVKLPFTCQCLWKIYGRPEKSLDLADQFCNTRICMGNRLLNCADVADCLASLKSDQQLFFDSNLIM